MKQLNKLPDITTMEYQSFRLHFNYLTVNHCIIYRLPSTSVLQFCNEFSTIQEDLIHNQADRNIFIGNFNIYMDIEDGNNTLNFLDTLECYNLSNLVGFKTHIANHTLDQALDDKTNPLVTSFKQGHQLSDHSFIHCLLSIQKPTPPTSQITYRKIKSIDVKAFNDDREQALCNADAIELIHNLLTLYNSSASNLLNTHAPLKTKKLRITHNQPWFSDKIRQEITICRHKEKTWREDPTEYNLNAFYNQLHFVSKIIKTAKRDYYIKAIQDNTSDYKKIPTANKLLYRN